MPIIVANRIFEGSRDTDIGIYDVSTSELQEIEKLKDDDWVETTKLSFDVDDKIVPTNAINYPIQIDAVVTFYED